MTSDADTPQGGFVLEIASPGHDVHRHVRLDGSRVLRIGRAYDNDLILDDPYVAAHEAVIAAAGTGGGWHITDAGSENGISVNDRALGSAAHSLKDGDVLKVGRTGLHVFAPTRNVAPALRTVATSRLFFWTANPFITWPVFALASGALALFSYGEVWSEQPGLMAAMGGGAAFMSIIIWAALWAVAGKLINHHPRFREQVGLASAYMLLSAGLTCIEAYVDYLSSDSMGAVMFSYIANGILIMLLIYGCLGFATDLTRHRRWAGGFYFTAGLLGSVFALGFIGAQDFDENPGYAYALEPYLSQLAPAQSVDEFMTGNEKVFTRHAFTHADTVAAEIPAEIPVSAPAAVPDAAPVVR